MIPTKPNQKFSFSLFPTWLGNSAERNGGEMHGPRADWCVISDLHTYNFCSLKNNYPSLGPLVWIYHWKILSWIQRVQRITHQSIFISMIFSEFFSTSITKKHRFLKKIEMFSLPFAFPPLLTDGYLFWFKNIRILIFKYRD